MLIAIIADASGLARQLKSLLSRDGGVRVVAECASGPAAIDAIQRFRPDLAFVAIRLPELSGFDVARTIAPSFTPGFVFLTNDPMQALAAFSVNALDCLSPPIDSQRLAVTLARARRRLTPPRVSSLMLAAAAASLRDVTRRLGVSVRRPMLEAPIGDLSVPTPQHIRVEREGRQRLVPIEAIDYVEAAKGRVFVRTGGERWRARESLGILAHWLPGDKFVRINRSVIVNSDRIAEVRHAGARADIVCLNDGTLLRVGPYFRFALRNAFPERL